MFNKLKAYQAHLSGKTHAYTLSWYGVVGRFSDALKAKWSANGGAAGGDDDLDLFGDDDDEDTAAAVKAAADAAKAKKKKVKPPEMSLIIFEVKPVDDTTNLDDLAQKIFGLK